MSYNETQKKYIQLSKRKTLEGLQDFTICARLFIQLNSDFSNYQEFLINNFRPPFMTNDYVWQLRGQLTWSLAGQWGV